MNGHFEIGAISPARYFLSIAVLIGVCFAFIAPDDDGMHFGMRLLHWQTQTVGAMAFLICTHLLLAKFDWFSWLNPWLRLILSGALGASAYSPVAQAFDLWTGLETPVSGGLTFADVMNEWVNLVPPATITWVVINAPWVLGLRLQVADQLQPIAQVPPPAALEDKAESPGSAMFALLPKSIGSDVVLLKSELHYLEVVTTTGRALILYRLRDAVAELTQGSDPAGYLGLQCHRSYWVATRHIVRLRKQGREGHLEMSTGRSVPVSRRHLSAVQATVESHR